MAMIIKDIERYGEEKTAIKLGSDRFTLPRHLMQGEKQSGLVSDGSTVSTWYWDGLATINEERYVYFPKCKLDSWETLATSHRKDALHLVNSLAFALRDAGEEFLNLTTGVFPLYRVYIYEDTKVLLLPPDLGDILSIAESAETKKREVISVIRGNAETNFRLITEMAELLYYAASGFLPFESEEIRGSGYPAADLGSLVSLPEKTCGFVNFILKAKGREMRDIMGNYSDGSNLQWFLDRSSLEWTLENRSEEEREKDVEEILKSPAYNSFLETSQRIARRNKFWRVKGTLITVSAVVAIVVGSFLFSYIKGLLEPPETKDLDPPQIIEEFYKAQSEADPIGITEAVKGAKLPQEMEVTGIHVTTSVRKAYETANILVNAQVWVEEGMPDLLEGSVVYGVVLEDIEETQENRYLATGIWYLSSPYEDSDRVPAELEDPSKIYVYKYRIGQDFWFSWNKRGWWNIIKADLTGYEFLGYEEVSTFTRSSLL